jgi:O-antigen ligase
MPGVLPENLHMRSAYVATAGPREPVFLLALTAPTLLAFNVSPSATFFNQLIALTGWGLLLWAVASRSGQRMQAIGGGSVAAMLVAMAAVLVGVAGSVSRGLPLDAALSSGGMLVAGGLVFAGAWRAGGSVHARPWMTALCLALVLAGLLGLAIGCVQVFLPQWADGKVLAAPTLVGRATGNLRQPNHLSTLMLWACAACVWLGGMHARQGAAASPAAMGRPVAGAPAWGERGAAWLGRRAPWVIGALVLGVMLTASRTGLVGVVMLAAWGLIDRSLPRGVRRALVLAPLVYAAGWLGMSALSHLQGQAFGGEARLHDGSDISSSRFAIWRDTLALIRLEPWVGVGFGQFNFAWSLTPSPERPVAFFDHTHNIVLQLLVELGLPLGGLVIALLGYALWRLAQQALRPAHTPGASLALGAGGARVLLYMVLLAGLHSLLEYPLWYAYFLLPTLAFWGLGLAADGGATPVPSTMQTVARPSTDGLPPVQTAQPAGDRAWRWGLRAGGAGMVVAAVLALADYLVVVQIFTPATHAGPLQSRIARGQQSVLFGFQADYAKATTEPAPPLAAFDRPLRHLIDARLMVAYAKALAAHGQTDKARFVADRLREFRRFADEPFLDVCAEPLDDADELPFQCLPYDGPALDWRDFR